ncbi:MAG TPA: WS/DGAT domain-containing protein, partial [Dehalococcoidia bacterium]|nr:WS/DGAT domain-containing protein [Dehalococcoidia bacterium]
GVMSYNGKLYFGLVADAQAAPDVERLRDFLDQSFVELKADVRRRADAAEPLAQRRAAESSQAVSASSRRLA